MTILPAQDARRAMQATALTATRGQGISLANAPAPCDRYCFTLLEAARRAKPAQEDHGTTKR